MSRHFFGCRSAAVGFLAAILFLCAIVPGQSATRPAATDQDTQDLLKELDTPGEPATTRPVAATPHADDSNSANQPREEQIAQLPQINWQRLIWLFAPSLATAAAVGISGSVVGSLVLLRREALAALAIPQIVAVGAAIGMRQGWPTLPPALAAAAVGLFYLVMSKRWGAANWILPSLYVAGLSISFLLIANKGQDVAELQKLFTGIDVAVSPEQARLAVPLLLAVATTCALLWRRWLLIAQAPAAAELAGLHPARWDALFLTLLTVVVLLGTDALGMVMVLTMLFLPGATVIPWTCGIPAGLLSAAGVSLLILGVGFVLANTMSWPLSHSVGGAGFAALVISHSVARLRK